MGPPTRRDFLRLAALTPVAYAAHRLLPTFKVPTDATARNVIVLVFDAWSANHLRLYGYPRSTMPNLDIFARRATMYHRHYSAGTFTVPGTASLLTGLHPWSHRAFSLGGEVTSSHRRHQLFHLLDGSHHTLGYSQNEYADLLLAGAQADLDSHPSISSFSLHQNLVYSLPLFANDSFTTYSSFENDIFQKGRGADGSLLLGPLRRLLRWRSTRVLDAEYRDAYPRGLPAATDLFRLEDVVEGSIQLLQNLSAPFFAYLHFFPPHGFYRPKGKYNHAFDDGVRQVRKPVHPLIQEDPGYDAQSNQALRYDQYMASWDAEVGRLLEFLRTSGLMDRSYVIVTSDHGEMFERGVIGHYCPLIYDPLIHVPLLIAGPGQTERVDVRSPTSSVDLLPTIAGLVGLDPPAWAQGQLLPGLGGSEDLSRSIYSMDAKMNSSFASLTRFSFALARDGHRLVHYRYPERDVNSFEMYDLENDPQELQDLFPAHPKLALDMQQELLDKLEEIDREFHSLA